ncbi:MAG TPA: hypothetical protein VFQ57_09550, partial [Sphingomonas sp.]|nr:hypothetical protein [Sphingomonas sp.]
MMEGFGRDTLRSGLGPAQDGDRARAEASDGASPRRARDSLFLMARMKVGGGDWSEVRVRNLSEGGLMAEYA